MTFYLSERMYGRALRMLGTFWQLHGDKEHETRAEYMADYVTRGVYNVMHDGVDVHGRLLG